MLRVSETLFEMLIAHEGIEPSKGKIKDTCIRGLKTILFKESSSGKQEGKPRVDPDDLEDVNSKPTKIVQK